MRSLYFCLVLFLYIDSHGQIYHPFPESDAMWRCGWGENGCALNDQYAEYQYLITGDTIVGAHTYHKLERSGVFDCAPPLSPWSGYMGAFRNDIAGRKVYIIPADSINEYVLYDFTLGVGDTIQGYLPDPENWGDPNIAVISAIDSIEVSDGYRKRWHFESSGNFWSGFMIEGIGGEFGPLEALMSRFDYNGGLNCFAQATEVVYTIGGGISCDLATSLIGKTLNNIQIYPNPANEQLTISGAPNIRTIEIHDINGRSMKRFTVTSTSEPVSLIVSDLPVGLYQIRVQEDQDHWQGCFVKLD